VISALHFEGERVLDSLSPVEGERVLDSLSPVEGERVG
jgi:hypothetical protein